jgi:Family of unknown function (DUF5343)
MSRPGSVRPYLLYVLAAYMLSVKNLPSIFEAIRTAGVLDRFTHSFLKQLGFASSTDRAVISVMRSLRFLDDSSVPTDRYKRYRDTSLSRVVMAEALRDAYSDPFHDQREREHDVVPGTQGRIQADQWEGGLDS